MESNSRKQQILRQLQLERERRRNYIAQGQSGLIELEPITEPTTQTFADLNLNFAQQSRETFLSTPRNFVETRPMQLNQAQLNSESPITSNLHRSQIQQLQTVSDIKSEKIQEVAENRIQNKDDYIKKMLAQRRANRHQTDSVQTSFNSKFATNDYKDHNDLERLVQPPLIQQSLQKSNTLLDDDHSSQQSWSKYQSAMLFAQQEIQKEILRHQHQSTIQESHNIKSKNDYSPQSHNISMTGQKLENADLLSHFANPHELYFQNEGRQTSPCQTAESKSPKAHYMKDTVIEQIRSGKASQTSLILDYEKEFKEKCTFQPSIKPFNSQQNQGMDSERLRYLSRDRNEVYNKRQQLKTEFEAKEVLDHCSFHPNVKRQGKARSVSTSETEKRLAREAERIREKKEKLKREFDEKELEECSFHPNINRKTKNPQSVNQEKCEGSQRVPIHQRANEILKQKQERMQQLRVDYDSQKRDQITFKPQINLRSEQLVQLKQETVQLSVTDRLYHDAQERINKLVQHQVEDDQCTFTPCISQTIQSQSEDFQDFQKRQDEFLQKKAERLRKLQNEIGQDYLFRPQINIKSEVICASDPQRNIETAEERIDRLGVKDQQKRRQMLAELESEHHKQYTFQPQINVISSIIAPAVSIIEKSDQVLRKRAELKKQFDEQQKQECTFQPRTNDNYKVESVYAVQNQKLFSQQLKAQLKEKQAKIAQARRAQEYQEIKDCTFQPVTNPTIAVPAADVEIKGLERHLELKELQRRKDQEQALREAEVFGYDSKFVAGQKSLPFQLQTSVRHEQHELKFQERLERLRTEQMKDCTFRPNLAGSSRMNAVDLGLTQYDMNMDSENQIQNY